ncbi:39S ribosomal protein L42, mitochondrial-like [Anneissia japonica]|uniref:39S ribosomal protein L42, mitochondrial-like n=1 Tax=Anneissia japonica TaxID=1529436 RepID=UPI001425A756|nr:39S ribosomal protein L42, mitochondrial-like [Anneissia japonica]
MAMHMKSTLLTCSRLICLKRITVVSHVLLHNGSSGKNFKSQWTDTSDGSMIVCYHPADDFPYEHTKPIIRKDPVKPDTLHSTESILKNKLQFDHYAMEKRGPSISDLSQMFFTTKHRWYPVGIRRRSLKNPNPPRDRDYL